MIARSSSRHAPSMVARLEAEAARERLQSVALPCLVWGMTAVLVFGGLHLYYLPRAQDMDLLVVAVTGKVVVGAVFWLLPHAAALWWLRCGGHARFVALAMLGVGAPVGLAGILWQVTHSPVGACIGLVIGGWVPVVEFLHAWSVTKLGRTT